MALSLLENDSRGLIGLSVALGAGLLIGLERERRKGEGPSRRAAGLRTFALAGLAGGITQWLQQPALVFAGGAAIVLLAGVAYWYGRRTSNDPGITTELALFVTYVVGVLAVHQPTLGASAAVVVAVLLAARDRLHRFATRILTENELHDLLLLAALTLVLLPLLPANPISFLGNLSSRRLLLLFVLILSLQGMGHVALRVVGARAGLPLAGFFAGFVSSTATVASMGAKVRAHPELLRPAAAGAMLSTAATWVQAALILAAVTPSLLAFGWTVLAVGAVVAAASGSLFAIGFLHTASAENDLESAQSPVPTNPLRVKEAALVAVFLSLANVIVVQAERWMGLQGALVASTLAALADAHASIAASAALHASTRLTTGATLGAVVLAVAANACVRMVVAWVSGGGRYARWIAASLLASTAAAAFAAWWLM